MLLNIPLSLYIHMPWCVRKCPYCDFNSHALRGDLPEAAYIAALIEDLQQKLHQVQGRLIHSLFIGGGTPSLFSPSAYEQLFQALNQLLTFRSGMEITMEANPGTVEQDRFAAFHHLGINRLSLGIQSFNDRHLKILGRIHNGAEAHKAVQVAKKAGFTNFNLDLMYGLPQQNLTEASEDLKKAIDLNPTHLSRYQLTLEPNTFFYKHPPRLPEDDFIWEMQVSGEDLLEKNNFHQYEISAYAQDHFQCQHNINYWEFGDYLAIGAGAHGKITDLSNGLVTRYWNIKSPKVYLNPASSYVEGSVQPSAQDLPLEFMMNVLRLSKPIPLSLFFERTQLPLQAIEKFLEKAATKQLLTVQKGSIRVTALGKRFLNNLLELL